MTRLIQTLVALLIAPAAWAIEDKTPSNTTATTWEIYAIVLGTLVVGFLWVLWMQKKEKQREQRRARRASGAA